MSDYSTVAGVGAAGGAAVGMVFTDDMLRTQFTIAPNLFSKLTKLKTKFGISCFKEGVSTALKSRYHPVLCVSYLVFVLAFLENLRFGLQFGLARKRNLVV